MCLYVLASTTSKLDSEFERDAKLLRKLANLVITVRPVTGETQIPQNAKERRNKQQVQ